MANQNGLSVDRGASQGLSSVSLCVMLMPKLVCSVSFMVLGLIASYKCIYADMDTSKD